MLYIILMHISHVMFFANELLLAVYFVFILAYGNDIRQKANLNSFEFKIGCKAGETTRSINAFSPGTAS